MGIIHHNEMLMASAKVIFDRVIFTVSFAGEVPEKAYEVDCAIYISGYALPRYRPSGDKYWHSLKPGHVLHQLVLGDYHSIDFNLTDMEVDDWIYISYPIYYCI